jgi:hypothetical protein
MEVIIFGFFNLLYFAIIAGVPFLALYLLYLLSKRVKRFGLLLFITLSILPLIWAGGSYLLFKDICSAAKPPIVYFKPTQHIDSILIDDTGIRNFTMIPASFSDISLLIDNNKLTFFEVTEGFENNQYFIRHSKKQEQIKIAQPQSQYKILLSAPTKIAQWWLAPIYKADISIIDIAQNKPILKATDWIFGGGLTGIYLRLIGGDQDYNYLSCGYISNEIGTWRPTLSANPRQSQYLKSDSDLILKTFNQ